MAMRRMVGQQNSGRRSTLYSHLSDITCCHRAILSPIESSLGLFIACLFYYVLKIKMRICLISENHQNVKRHWSVYKLYRKSKFV